MTFLTPLYALGALAVALPVLFHLLRRTPSKRQTFSSLMFLAPTPPRFTRRSRINNWLLLLLRAGVLMLLALAFGRPFFERDMAVAGGGVAGRRIAILLDTSASMKREDLWQQAKARVDDALRDVGPADEVSLSFFDRGVRGAVSFDQWNRLDPAQRPAAVRAAVDAVTPTWQGTALGDAVAETAERLAADETPGRTSAASRTLVLVSDLQQGGRPEALQNHTWPESVRLDVRPVIAKSPTNAGVQAVRPSPDAPVEPDGRTRVRIASVAAATPEQFTVTWANAAGPVAGKPQSAYVPPGRGQVVRIDAPPAGVTADRIVLTGDAHDFDNTLFVAPRRQQVIKAAYLVGALGKDPADKPESPTFYLFKALAETPQRRVDLDLPQSVMLSDQSLSGTVLLIVGRPLDASPRAAVRRHIDRGGDVLYLMRAPPDGDAAAEDLTDLTGVDGWQTAEAAGGNFSLVARLDTTHPLLAPFADPRFGDFSRVHFWKHRRVTPPAGARVIASFDNGDPWLLEQPVGRGRVFVMTSGWQPADSQLALSPKFVPLLDGLLRPREGEVSETQYTVGDALRVPADVVTPWSLAPPAGPTIPLAAGSTTTFDAPGIYTLNTAAGPFAIAVNLRPDESRTTPVSPADFAQWGAKLVDGRTEQVSSDDRHQAQRAELENRQKLWRWLIVGALGFVAAETFLAGRLVRRAAVANG